jgi:hypothetical protein
LITLDTPAQQFVQILVGRNERRSNDWRSGAKQSKGETNKETEQLGSLSKARRRVGTRHAAERTNEKTSKAAKPRSEAREDELPASAGTTRSEDVASVKDHSTAFSMHTEEECEQRLIEKISEERTTTPARRRE